MPEPLELDWLMQERPRPLPLDPALTARVRGELLARRRAPQRPRLRASRPRALRVSIGGAGLAGAAVVALLATAGGASTVAASSSQRLTRLAITLAADAHPIGDATLVLRTQNYPNAAPISGADLYADNGDYYYAPTVAGLPAAIGTDQTVNQGAADQEQRDLAAARAALSGPLDAARRQMSVANLQPGVTPTAIDPGSAAGATAALGAKLQRARANAVAKRTESLVSQEDGMIWDNSIDALLAGAGDPQVRAGVLKLLATIPQVAVTSGTLDGRPTLILTASLFRESTGLYQERLVLGANTGVPLELVGGDQGRSPSVTVAYTVTRTTVARVAAGGAG